MDCRHGLIIEKGIKTIDELSKKKIVGFDTPFENHVVPCFVHVVPGYNLNKYAIAVW